MVAALLAFPRILTCKHSILTYRAHLILRDQWLRTEKCLVKRVTEDVVFFLLTLRYIPSCLSCLEQCIGCDNRKVYKIIVVSGAITVRGLKFFTWVSWVWIQQQVNPVGVFGQSLKTVWSGSPQSDCFMRGMVAFPSVTREKYDCVCSCYSPHF